MSATTSSQGTGIQRSFEQATRIATLSMAMAGRANKVNDTLGTALSEALDWALEQEGLRGIILASGHKDFCVGADLDMLYGERDATALLARVSTLQALLRKLETCGVPVVAALTGSALGGGYELALACHHRIARDDPRLKLGLPEVTLGVIPGGGGTQRLPRLIGMQAALDVIVQGKVLGAQAAKAAGLVDQLCPNDEAVREAARYWIAAHATADAQGASAPEAAAPDTRGAKAEPSQAHRQPWDRQRFRFPPPAPGSPEARDLFLAACALLYKKTAGALEAPKLAISAIYEGAGLRFERALEVEARYFVKLATSDQAKDSIRTLWFHRRAAEKHEGLPATEDAGIGKVGILGAGMMGAGLAYLCATRGYPVVLRDINQEALDQAGARCNKLASARARSQTERDEILARIHSTTASEDLQGCDLVVEAVFEDLALKHRVIEEAAPLLAEGGIWASNSSALPIGEQARVAPQPERFLGLHFFSPVERMPLVEVVKGPQTDEQTVACALAFCRGLNKTPIVVNDGYGFYTTRVFAAYILEGAQLVAEGHVPATIEWAARASGMAVGALQVFDEISLTLGQHVVAGARHFAKRSFEMAGVALIDRMVDELKRPGKAGGAGFYNYRGGRRTTLWPGLKQLVTAAPGESSVPELGQRLLLVQCVEAARCFEDGVLERARDAEIGAVLGLGFAPQTGGPLSYLDRLGLPAAVKRLDALADQHGERYAPPALLRGMAERGETFFDSSKETVPPTRTLESP